jgi:hypothetical protein
MPPGRFVIVSRVRPLRGRARSVSKRAFYRAPVARANVVIECGSHRFATDELVVADDGREITLQPAKQSTGRVKSNPVKRCRRHQKCHGERHGAQTGGMADLRLARQFSEGFGQGRDELETEQRLPTRMMTRASVRSRSVFVFSSVGFSSIGSPLRCFALRRKPQPVERL